MTNQEYIDKAQALHDRDLELARAALEVVNTYEEALASASAEITNFSASLPDVPAAARSAIRNTIDSVMNQLSSNATQMSYVKNMLVNYTNTGPATPGAPAPTV